MHRNALVLPVLLSIVPAAHAQMVHPAGMTHNQVVETAMSAAPASISREATVGWIDSTGRFNQMRAGTNGFTCFIIRPDPVAGPICADRIALAWLTAQLSGQAAPPQSSVPGVAWMGAGGSHYEDAQGNILFEHDLSQHAPGSRRVVEGPHWMLLAPIDPTTSGLPVKFNEHAYIMFAGTPWAHVMIHQNPAQMMAGHRH